ncbi:unnamed protein product [Amoebophrya sp. A25]|nr:unnamed protein product [Amoebophrya sp. A25]|eukprot:GSA25T00008995001.1
MKMRRFTSKFVLATLAKNMSAVIFSVTAEDPQLQHVDSPGDGVQGTKTGGDEETQSPDAAEAIPYWLWRVVREAGYDVATKALTVGERVTAVSCAVTSGMCDTIHSVAFSDSAHCHLWQAYREIQDKLVQEEQEEEEEEEKAPERGSALSSGSCAAAAAEGRAQGEPDGVAVAVQTSCAAAEQPPGGPDLRETMTVPLTGQQGCSLSRKSAAFSASASASPAHPSFAGSTMHGGPRGDLGTTEESDDPALVNAAFWMCMKFKGEEVLDGAPELNQEWNKFLNEKLDNISEEQLSSASTRGDENSRQQMEVVEAAHEAAAKKKKIGVTLERDVHRFHEAMVKHLEGPGSRTLMPVDGSHERSSRSGETQKNIVVVGRPKKWRVTRFFQNQPPRWYLQIDPTSRTMWVVFRGTNSEMLSDHLVNASPLGGPRWFSVDPENDEDGPETDVAAATSYVRPHYRFHNRLAGDIKELIAQLIERRRDAHPFPHQEEEEDQIELPYDKYLDEWPSRISAEGSSGDEHAERPRTLKDLSEDMLRGEQEKHDADMDSIDHASGDLSIFFGGDADREEQEKKLRMWEDNITHLRKHFDRVVFTGHSQGGALALMLHGMWQQNPQLRALLKDKSIRTVAFSAPPFFVAGNDWTQTQKNIIVHKGAQARFADATNIIFNNDIIPRVIMRPVKVSNETDERSKKDASASAPATVGDHGHQKAGDAVGDNLTQEIVEGEGVLPEVRKVDPAQERQTQSSGQASNSFGASAQECAGFISAAAASTSPPEEHTFLAPRHSRVGSHLDGQGAEPAQHRCHQCHVFTTDTSPSILDELAKAMLEEMTGFAVDAEVEKITRQQAESPSKAAVEPNSTMRLEPTSNILVFAPLGKILWLRDMEAWPGEHGRGITQAERIAKKSRKAFNYTFFRLKVWHLLDLLARLNTWRAMDSHPLKSMLAYFPSPQQTGRNDSDPQAALVKQGRTLIGAAKSAERIPPNVFAKLHRYFHWGQMSSLRPSFV